MLQDFKAKRITDDLRERKRLDILQKKIDMELQRVRRDLNANDWKIERLEAESSRAMVVKQNSRLWDRIANLFRRGNYYEASRQIEGLKRQLESAKEEQKRLEKSEEELIEDEKTVISKIRQTREHDGCFREQDGKLIITDTMTSLGDHKKIDYSMLDPEKKVLVHCTNFFPRNNVILSDWDGAKLGYPVTVRYNGVNREFRTLVHRHEVHCTINARVESTGAGEGNWDKPNYIVIDNYAEHQAEIECDSSSDAWTKGTSIHLSKDAVIMVNIQDRGKLPISKEELNNYNIIYYDGDPTICLQNFLRINGYEIAETDSNDAAHAWSSRACAEGLLGTRDRIISYMRDEDYISKEPPILTPEEIGPFMSILSQNYSDTFSRFSRDQEAMFLESMEINKEGASKYLETAKFILVAGLRRTQEGNYTFATDEEVLANIDELKQFINDDDRPTKEEKDLVREIFGMQEQYEKEQSQKPRPTAEQISQMTLGELYRFKNQLECETLQKVVPPGMLIGKKSSIQLSLEGGIKEEDFKKIRSTDGVISHDLGGFGATFSVNLPLYIQAEGVKKAYACLQKKKDEIASRTDPGKDVDDDVR